MYHGVKGGLYMYEKPIMLPVDEAAEGVYAASEAFQDGLKLK